MNNKFILATQGVWIADPTSIGDFTSQCLTNFTPPAVYHCEYCRTDYHVFQTNCKNCGGTVKQKDLS